MHTRSPWYWVPSLYFAEGLPYVAVMILSLVMYKRMGISNTEIALYTSWLNLPWVIKPLWSPFVDLLRTKRWWIVTTQLLLGAGLAGIAFTIPTSHFSRPPWPYSGWWPSAPPPTTSPPTGSICWDLPPTSKPSSWASAAPSTALPPLPDKGCSSCWPDGWRK